MRLDIVKKFLLNYLKIFINKSKRDNKSTIIATLSLFVLVISLIFSFFIPKIINSLPFNDQIIIKSIFPYITGVYFVFIFLPISGLSMRGEDPKLLLKFPITYSEAFFIEAFKSMSNVWILSIFFFPISAILFYLSKSIMGLIIGLFAYLLFYFHAAGVGYIFFSFLQGFFEDRRFRDIIGVIGGFFGILIYVLIYLLPELIPLDTLLDLSYQTHSFLPSGWIISILFKKNFFLIIPMLIVFGLTILVGNYSFKYSYYISIERSGSKDIRSKRILKLPLTRSINAMIDKDIKYYFRDTNQKISLISSMVFVIIFGLQPFFQSGKMTSFDLKYLGVFAGFFFAFSYFNYLGYERDGIYKLLSSPIKRRNIILSKNFLLLIIFLTYILIINLGLMLLIDIGISIEYFLISVSTFLIVLSLSNNIGVRYPQKMPKELRGGRNGSLIGVLLAFLGTAILLIPIALHFFGELIDLPISVTMPLIFLYAITCYLIGTKTSIDYLKKNEVKIMEKFQDEQ